MSTKYGPAQLDPSEWETLGYFYRGPSEEEAYTYRDDERALEARLRDIFASDEELGTFLDSHVTFHDNGGCASCGAIFFHGAVVRALSGDVIAIGGICAETWSLGSALDMRRKRARKARLSAERKEAANIQFAAVLEDNPGLESALETEHHIIQDIRSRGRQYGSLSEKQIALVFKIQREERERQERAQIREDKLAEAILLPEGRYQITGSIVSYRWDANPYSYYGESTLKGLIEMDDGNRVWGTLPRAIEDDVEEGSRIVLTGTVTRSNDDDHFGFYKRPSKAAIVG